MLRGAVTGIALQSVCHVGYHWNGGLRTVSPSMMACWSWGGVPFTSLSRHCPCRSLCCRAPCVGESGNEAEDPGLGGVEWLPCLLMVFPSCLLGSPVRPALRWGR